MYQFLGNETHTLEFSIEQNGYGDGAGPSCGEWYFQSAYDDYPHVNATYTLYACDGVCDATSMRTKGALLRGCRQVARHQLSIEANEDEQGRDLVVSFQDYGTQTYELSPITSANAALDFTPSNVEGELFVDLTKQYIERPQVCPVGALDASLPCPKRGTLLKLTKDVRQILTFRFASLRISDISKLTISSSTLDFFLAPLQSLDMDCSNPATAMQRPEYH